MSPQAKRWPYVSTAEFIRSHNSSLCSSLSGSLELLPAKITDGTKKRQEAVRKVLEQRKMVEEEEERWKERRRQREKKLAKVVAKRAQANDSHVPLSLTNQAKLKQFRKQDLQRRKEYKDEMREIQERVKGRPLLLEQVTQVSLKSTSTHNTTLCVSAKERHNMSYRSISTNARHAAEKRYKDTLRGCGLSEDFVRGKVSKHQQPDYQGLAFRSSFSSDSTHSYKEENDAPAKYSNVFNDDYQDDYEDSFADQELEEQEAEKDEKEEDDIGDKDEGGREREDIGRCLDDGGDHHAAGGYHYSDDDDLYSDASEHSLPLAEVNEGSDLIKRRQSVQSILSYRSSQQSQNSQSSVNDEESTAFAERKSDEDD
ncbi:hypothetical protein UPYG_G00067940 [Umbra pygmaea]|uniref:Protein FAM161A n=1 Tax=Umbra pygmaea TaxID=75934 RepID=A0ABD0XAV9_UMBPY